MSATASSSSVPAQRSSGSQFGSKEVVAPAVRARRSSSGRPARPGPMQGRAAEVQVPRPRQQRVGYVLAPQPVDGAGRGEDGAVLAAAEDDRGAGGDGRFEPAGRDVDLARGERLEHVASEVVVAHHAHEGHAQAQACHPAGHDRRRGADDEPDGGDELLHLAEDRRRVLAHHQDVGVELARDEQVDVAPRGRVIRGRLGVGRPTGRRLCLGRWAGHAG